MKRTPEGIRQIVAQAVREHGVERDALVPVLQRVQAGAGMLGREAMEAVAEAFGLSEADVWGTASFYSFFETRPHGTYVIRMCKTISCDMAGKEAIVAAIEARLGVRVGETTPDRRFTLLETNCLGWCHQGPAMLVNDEVHTSLTAEKAIEILDGLR